MFAAAYTNDTTVQQRIIDQIWARVATNATDPGVFWNVYGLNGNKNLLAQNIKYVLYRGKSKVFIYSSAVRHRP